MRTVGSTVTQFISTDSPSRQKENFKQAEPENEYQNWIETGCRQNNSRSTFQSFRYRCWEIFGYRDKLLYTFLAADAERVP